MVFTGEFATKLLFLSKALKSFKDASNQSFTLISVQNGWMYATDNKRLHGIQIPEEFKKDIPDNSFWSVIKITQKMAVLEPYTDIESISRKINYSEFVEKCLKSNTRVTKITEIKDYFMRTAEIIGKLNLFISIDMLLDYLKYIHVNSFTIEAPETNEQPICFLTEDTIAIFMPFKADNLEWENK